MKKLILTYLLLLISTNLVFAASRQQLDDGNGNILGTQSNPLHVNCISGCGGGSGGGGNAFSSSASQGTLGFLDVQGTQTLIGGNAGFVYTGVGSTVGNVGIGSINPGVALDVNGTIRTNDIIGSNGKLGIGSPNPGMTLDVQGTTRLTPTFGNITALDVQGTATIEPSPLTGLVNVNGGGIAGELVNKGYELIMPDPVGIGSSQDEVQGMRQYQNKLYLGYFTAGTSAEVWNWDGNKENFFYKLGKGNTSFSDFVAVSDFADYNGNLYAALQSKSSTNAGVWVYNPNAILSNFVQFPSSGAFVTQAITVPNDSTNNAIFGSTSYSIEYYGRIDDDLAGASIFEKRNSAGTNGFGIHLSTSQGIVVFIYQGGAPKSTSSNNSVFTLGNYHDIIFSWTSGAAPVIYVDGVAVGIASSTTVTTPDNDTSDTGIIGNNPQNTAEFAGTFRRLRIWRNYAVTSGDATTLAAGGTIANSPTGQYLFSEGSGTTTADSSGNNNTGTLSNTVYWNNNLMDVSFAGGNDFFVTALRVFKGNLYAGAGYLTSRIYSFNGTTWTTAFAGLSGYGNIQDLYVYKGLLFATLGGSSGGAIISSPDGVTWTTETTASSTIVTEFNKFVEFKGNLYASMIKAGAGTNDIYKRSQTGTWAVEIPSISAGQVWGMNNYNNILYAGATTSGGATIYKSYDGFNFIKDFQMTSANQLENYSMVNFDGSLYFGIGYTNSTSGTVWRKTDSVGQQTDWINNVFGNHVYCNTQNSYNWTNDCSLTTYSSPWIFNSNVGIGLQSGNPANSALDVIGGISLGVNNASNYTNTTAPLGGMIAEGNVGIGSLNPGQNLDVQGTIRTTGFQLSTNPSSGFVLTANSVGIGTWAAAPSASGSGTVTSVQISTPNSSLTIGGTNPVISSGVISADINLTHANTWTGQQIFNTANVGIGSTDPGTALDVMGTVRVIGFTDTTNPTSGYVMTTNSVGVGTWAPAPTTSGGSGTVNSGTTGQNAFYATAGTAVSGTSALIFDGNGNVGINSSVPGSRLEVNGSVRIFGGGLGTLFVNGNTSIGTTQATKLLTVGSGGIITLTADNNNTVTIGGTASINGNGFTTSAGGVFQSSANSGSFGDTSATAGSSATFAGGGSTTSIAKMRSTSANGTTDSIQFQLGNNGAASGMFMQDNSGVVNIGIGSTVPNGMLDVEGTVNPIVLFGSIPALGVNQNVGIGSAKPGQMLDVQGTIRISKLGSSLSILIGTNGCKGQATLASGTVTINTACTPPTSEGIFLQDATTGSLVNVGTPTVGTVTSGVSFVINSSNALDSSNVNWVIWPSK